MLNVKTKTNSNNNKKALSLNCSSQLTVPNELKLVTHCHYGLMYHFLNPEIPAFHWMVLGSSLHCHQSYLVLVPYKAPDTENIKVTYKWSLASGSIQSTRENWCVNQQYMSQYMS